MIRINTAKSVANMAYVGHDGLGPFSPDGDELFEVTSIRSSYDSLQERPGIYGENHVNHRELHANVYVDPWHGFFPNPLGQVYVYEKTPSGGWGTGAAVFPAFRLSPAHPWIESSRSSQRLRYAFKASPHLIRTMEVRWAFDYTLRTYIAETVTATETRCDALSTGTKLASLTENGWVSKYRDPRSPSMKTFDPLIAKKFCNEMWALAQAGLHNVVDAPRTAKFPYFSKATAPENPVTARQIMLKLQWLPEDRYLLPDDVKSHGELAVEAIATLDTNSINMFEFLQGLKRPQELVPKLKNLSKLKTHAGNYLGVQYGVLPLVSDLETLKDILMGTARPYFDSNNFQVLTAGHSVARNSDGALVETTNRVKICVNPTDPALFTLSEKLRDIGGFPSIDNLWELIPYSFVIDWFVNVGDMLESLDARFRMSTLPIMYSTTSSKTVITPNDFESLTALGVSGECSITLYSRAVSPNAPTPPLTFEVSNELPNHWLEAGALIVTARK